MGLDMYLNKRTYIGNKWRAKEGNLVRVIIPEGDKATFSLKPDQIKNERISEIEEEVMYWRKANHIHKWFVDNCQDGEDDCRDAHVSGEQLQTLLDLCKKVLSDHSKAEELLPTESGFFFGGIEYDEYYFSDLQETADALEKILAEDPSGDYIYHSSW